MKPRRQNLFVKGLVPILSLLNFWTLPILTPPELINQLQSSPGSVPPLCTHSINFSHLGPCFYQLSTLTFFCHSSILCNSTRNHHFHYTYILLVIHVSYRTRGCLLVFKPSPISIYLGVKAKQIKLLPARSLLNPHDHGGITKSLTLNSKLVRKTLHEPIYRLKFQQNNESDFRRRQTYALYSGKGTGNFKIQPFSAFCITVNERGVNRMYVGAGSVFRARATIQQTTRLANSSVSQRK